MKKTINYWQITMYNSAKNKKDKKKQIALYVYYLIAILVILVCGIIGSR